MTAAADQAQAFRRRIMESDDRFATALIRLVEPLRARHARNPTPRPDLLRAARRIWINDFPSFGSLDGPHPALHGTCLAISETRACAASFDLPRWSAPTPAPDAAPAVALLGNNLEVRPGILRFSVSLLALVGMGAVADWFAAPGERDDAGLLADLAALAAASAGQRRPAPFACPAAAGRWAGAVVAAPPACIGVRTGAVLQVGSFIQE